MITNTVDALGLGTGYGSWREREMRYDEGWQRSPSGLMLPRDVPHRQVVYGPRPIAIDLFCGAGGMSLGFHSAGWNVVGALEWDAFAAMTYLYNLGDPDCIVHFVDDENEKQWRKAVREQEKLDLAFRIGGNPAREQLTREGRLGGTDGGPTLGCRQFWLGDVRKVTGAEMLSALGLEAGDVDCVTGGPPCQGYSISGKRDVMDPRNSLVFEFARLVVELQPKTFIMENVPGIRSMRTPLGRPVLDELMDVFEAGGWDRHTALNALAGEGGVMPNQGIAYGPKHPKRDRASHGAEDDEPELPSRPERRRATRAARKNAKRAEQLQMGIFS